MSFYKHTVFFCRRQQRPKTGGKKIRKRTNEGLTQGKQSRKMKNSRRKNRFLDSRPTYPNFEWTARGSSDYWKALDFINASYRKMLEIGKAKTVFRSERKDVTNMLNAKTREEFFQAKTNIQSTYVRHIEANKARLKNFRVNTELVLDPRKYSRNSNLSPPTNREIIVKEQILTFEQYMLSLNIFKCSICRECNIDEKPPSDDPNYICKECRARKDPEYFLQNNLHPVWYLIDDNGDYVLDTNGDKVPQYHIPQELSCLSMYEKLLIRRCANFVPTFHLRNGVFGIKGHCVTFPQDITEMCDELPQKKDTIVTFIRNIGNKDTCSVFPTSLRVNRKKILDALLWLKKHNPFYGNIQIKAENLDWMDGKEEVNVSTKGEDLDIKCTARSEKENEEEEYVSNVHCTNDDCEDGNFPMQTVHANSTKLLPCGKEAEPIDELVQIAKDTNQAENIMHFPPTDFSKPVS